MQNDVGIGAIGIAIGALFTGLFSWLTQRMRGKAETDIAVIEQWEKLTKGWADRLSAVERDFSEYRQQMAKEVEQLRRDHAEELEKIRRDHSAEIEEMRNKHRKEMRALREQNEGLQRMIAQSSQSTAQLISSSPVTHPKEEGHDD